MTRPTSEYYAVAPVRSLYDGQAFYGICLHEDCRIEEDRSRYRTPRKGSPGQAESAVLDHLRDKHGVTR